jgi:hypothetical protein
VVTAPTPSPPAPTPTPAAAAYSPPPPAATTPPIASTPAPAPPLVSVMVKVTPAADVSVDGAAAGKSPLTLRLPAGVHAFVFSHPSYQPLRRVIDLKPGARRDLSVDLRDEAIKKK